MFATPTDKILVSGFDDIVSHKTKSPLERDTDYKVEDIVASPLTGVITDRRVITLDSPLSGGNTDFIAPGIGLNITPSGGFEQSALINRMAGQKIETEVDLEGEIGDAVSIAFPYVVLELIDVPEAWYYFSGGPNSNELLVVRETRMNPHITHVDLVGVIDPSKIPDKGELIAKSKQALRMVFTSLANLGNVYDRIYSYQIWTLLTYKVLELIIDTDTPSEIPNKFSVYYDNYLESFSSDQGLQWQLNQDTGEKETEQPVYKKYEINL